jgi:hypothetical protein
VERWTPPVVEATQALRPVFDLPATRVVSFDDAMASALQAQRGILEALGLSPATVR